MKRVARPNESVWRWHWFGDYLWSPFEFFERLRERWVWIPAYLMTAGLLAAGTGLSFGAIRLASHTALVNQQFSDDVIGLVSNAQVAGLWIAPLMSPFVTPVLMAYLLLFLSLFSGIAVRFGRLFALTMWSFVPFIGVRYLIQGAVIAWRGEASTPVDLSAGALLPQGVSPILKAIAGQADPFYLWSLALLAIGYSVFMRRPIKTGIFCGAIALIIRLGFSLSLAI